MEVLKNLIPANVQTTLIFFVNGKKVMEPDPDPEWTLLWYLRRKLHLTGTKYGCGEGGCGACTVMVSQYTWSDDRVKHIAVNACLTPVCAMHGFAVTTVEGIGSTQDRLHPVQERIAKAHGSQCGFCTPGIVMSMYTLLRNNQNIKYSDIETALQGNLCRCTGYRPIIEGFKTFMEGWEKLYNFEGNNNNGLCTLGKECCRNKNDDNSNNLFNKSLFTPYDPTQEPIFPPELKLERKYSEEYLHFKGENVSWIRPKTLEDLLIIKSEIPTAKIVVGNSEIGIETKFKKKIYPILLYPSIINKLKTCDFTSEGIIIGATVSLTELVNILEIQIKNNYGKAKVYEAIKEMLYWFAGNQIRNVASLVGNIITASPISDLNPILMACSAILHVSSIKRGSRKVTINEKFFSGYRNTTLEADEVVISVEIPFTEITQYFKAYKQARRKDDDISIVTSAFNVKLDPISKTVVYAKLCYGGMGVTTLCADKTSKALIGYQWTQNVLDVAFNSLTEELQLDISVPGGMADYRKSLCLSLFFRFYLHVLQKAHVPNGFNLLHDKDKSGIGAICSMQPESSQYFEIKKKSCTDVVGLPITHLSALKQATGEALYCDDIPSLEQELYLKLVFSTQAHAKIKSVDASKALSVPGVQAFLSAADLDEECNKMGPIIKDEQIFCSEIVTSRACVIGAIVAKSESIANKAKDLVIIEYELVEPVIVTLEDAITQKSFFSGCPRKLVKGDVSNAFSKSNHVIEGQVRNGAQEHFYLETMSAYAIRKEDELEIIATTQNPEDIAHIASEALRIPNHKVICKVKRLGGGFGGKETRASVLAVPVAIAAYKLKRPVRAVLDRDEDMQIMGYRHPCLIKYKVGFNNQGVLNGAKFEIYCNAGNSMDISCSMLERAILHVDNCYFVPNIEVVGYLCKTNMPSNTAFRGFGAPQAMLAAENMIRDIATMLNTRYEEIMEINLYQEGSLTHYNQILTYCTLSRCWTECIKASDYWQRKRDVENFNRYNRWKKRGISLVPTKYGISFQTDVLMQASALLLVYKDGSVLISIGGVEMGQGLYTKMIQVASKGLEIEHTKIHISEMATDKISNSSPTAASVSSDLYGMAILDACNVLRKRLEPFKIKNPDGKWEDWVIEAYVNRIQLSATGFYAAPKIDYNPVTNSGNMFEYFTYGVACSEVIVDCLTGDHQVLRTDIVMDVGESLNPAIDIGQIEGAFMQGYGFYTLEEMVFSDRGEALTRGPGTYKLPGFADIPKEFNVSLLRGAPNPRAVYSSKAVGEPPLFLASSVFFAINEAIKSARCDSGVSTNFTMATPATCARIRMACEDLITAQVAPTISIKGKPWNVTP